MRPSSADPSYAEVSAAVLKAYPNILARWIPGGIQQGSEYSVCNPLRADQSRGSFKVNLNGKWADFATGDAGGDPISLYAYLLGLDSQGEAKQALAEQFGLTPSRAGLGPDPLLAEFLARVEARKKAQATAVPQDESGWVQGPAPVDAPAPVVPVGCPFWAYRTPEGLLLGVVYRMDPPGGRKEFRPITWWEWPGEPLSGQWRMKGFARPLPLWHQQDLVRRPEAPVLLVEGEKAAVAGVAHFPDHVVMTWPGGAQQAAHVDVRPLAGRQVKLLPDHDEPGRLAMRKLAERLIKVAARLQVAQTPDGLEAGWDVADGTWATPAEAQAWLAGLSWATIPTQPGSVAPAGTGTASPRFEALLARANGQGPQYEVTPTATWTPTPIPVPILAQLEAEILRRVPVQHPVAAQQTALAMAARLAGRQVVSSAGDPTSLYLALAAPSVGDVRAYLQLSWSILEQIGLEASARQQRLSVPTQIHKLLWRQPASLYLCSEWGTILQFAKRQPAGTTEQALTLLSEVWDAKPIVIDVDDLKLDNAGVGAAQQIIRAPHLTMLAALSQDQLATAVKLSEVGRGALEQIQYWILADEDFTLQDPDELTTAPLPADLLAELQRISQAVTVSGNMAGVPAPSLMPAQVEARFAVAIKPFYAALDELKPHRSVRAILTTSRLIIRRVASILAFWLNPVAPVITEALVQWSVNLEVARLTGLLARFASLSSEDGKLSAYQKVLDFITTEGGKGAGHRALNRFCWAYRNLADDKRDALIQQLLTDEAVVEIQPPSKPGARQKAPVYVARQFVREKG